MRRHVIMSAAIVAVSGLSLVAGDALSQLGLTASDAKYAALEGVSAGYVPLGTAGRAFKSAAPALRAQIVTEGIKWAKAYVASPEFAAEYAKRRASRKPEAPHFDGTPEQEFARQQAEAAAEQAKSQEELKTMLASMKPEQRKEMEATLAQVQEIQKRMNTPEMRQMQIQSIAEERKSHTAEYEQDMKKWSEEYPEQPSALIAKRLRAFLDVSGTVDFNAQLESRDGRQRFTNPEYERKSDQWKMCFRAGKAAVSAARAAAQAWLKELGQ